MMSYFLIYKKRIVLLYNFIEISKQTFLDRVKILIIINILLFKLAIKKQ